jgi:hypothetical protein
MPISPQSTQLAHQLISDILYNNHKINKSVLLTTSLHDLLIFVVEHAIQITTDKCAAAKLDEGLDIILEDI